MNADERRLDQITEKVIGCAYRIGNNLGCGFLEKVYENALAIEFARQGLSIHQQYPMSVLYDGKSVGEYVADFLVEGEVIVEIKSAKRIDDIHVAQCLNYLKATGMKVCLLLNFGGPAVEIRRIVNKF